MEKDKETKKKLIKSARAEFIEKGYMNASLRNICKNAGVTTGALYFFFKDKDELFDNVFSEPLMALKYTLNDHFRNESDSDGMDISPEGLSDDFEAASAILTVLFKYREEFDVIMNRAQGSRYENIVDSYVDMIYKHYLDLYWKMKGYKSQKQLTAEDRFIVHWMSHDQIDIFIHLLTHCKDEKQAQAQLGNMFNYMIGGWVAVVRKAIV